MMRISTESLNYWVWCKNIKANKGQRGVEAGSFFYREDHDETRGGRQRLVKSLKVRKISPEIVIVTVGFSG